MQRKTTYKKPLFPVVCACSFAVSFTLSALVCFIPVNVSAVSAEFIWKVKTGAAISDSSLAVDDRIYAASADKHLYCWDINSGKNIWKTRFKQRLYYSPVYYEGNIFVVETFSTGKIYAVDAENGDKKWSVKIGKEISRPVVLDGRIIVASDKQLVMLRLTDGFVLERAVAGDNISSICVWNGYLVAVTNAGDLEVYDSRLDFISKKSFGPGGVFLFPSDSCIYGTTSTGSIFKTNSISEIAWKNEYGLPSFRNTIASGDYIYSIAEGGLVVILSEDTGELIKEIEIPGNVFSYAGFYDGLILISEPGVMYFINGDILYNVDNGAVGRKVSTPVFSSGDKIYFPDSDGFLYSYEIKM